MIHPTMGEYGFLKRYFEQYPDKQVRVFNYDCNMEGWTFNNVEKQEFANLIFKRKFVKVMKDQFGAIWYKFQS